MSKKELDICKIPTIPSIVSLHKEKVIKETNKIDIYNIVLNKIVDKILYTNRQTDKTYVIFEVPKILIGYPQYDMKSCILFIINKLSENDYYVEFVEPFYIYIDWGSKCISNESKINDRSSNIESKTKEILKHFPGIDKVEYIYEDVYLKQKNNTKKKDDKERKHKKKT